MAVRICPKYCLVVLQLSIHYHEGYTSPNMVNLFGCDSNLDMYYNLMCNTITKADVGPLLRTPSPPPYKVLGLYNTTINLMRNHNLVVYLQIPIYYVTLNVST